MSYSCLKPRIAIQKEDGKKPIFIHIRNEDDYEYYLKVVSKKCKTLLIPCGKCPNCLKKKSQEWTSRLLKEKDNFKYAYFITFTYDDKNLKDLNKRDLQLFLKRYRKSIKTELKYYITGEYGEVSNRSHYHAIFFQNKPISDLKLYGNNLFISSSFNKLWSMGNCLISRQVNERSIRYTISYTLKKLGESKIVLMSKGLGLSFLNEKKDMIKFQKGFYTFNGFKQNLPFYFKRKLKESSDLDDIEYLKFLEELPRDSTRLSGHFIGDLLDVFDKNSSSLALKGKGAF